MNTLFDLFDTASAVQPGGEDNPMRVRGWDAIVARAARRGCPSSEETQLWVLVPKATRAKAPRPPAAAANKPAPLPALGCRFFADDDDDDDDDDSIVCLACGQTTGGEALLLCDGEDCAGARHTFCCAPPVLGQPEAVGEWYCSPACEPQAASSKRKRKRCRVSPAPAPAAGQRRVLPPPAPVAVDGDGGAVITACCGIEERSSKERAEAKKQEVAEFVRGRLGDGAAATFTRVCEVTVKIRDSGDTAGISDVYFRLFGIRCRTRGEMIEELQARM